jgi:hypothetical protein
MNDQTKQAHSDKIDAQINEWNAKLQLSKAKLDNGAATVRVHYAEKEAQFIKKLDELRTAGSEKFESMKVGVHDAWLELMRIAKSPADS